MAGVDVELRGLVRSDTGAADQNDVACPGTAWPQPSPADHGSAVAVADRRDMSGSALVSGTKTAEELVIGNRA